MRKEVYLAVQVGEESAPKMLEAIGSVAGASLVDIDVLFNENGETDPQNNDRGIYNEELVTFLQGDTDEEVAVITKGDIERFSEQSKTHASQNTIRLFTRDFMQNKLFRGLCYQIEGTGENGNSKSIGLLARHYDQFLSLLDGPLSGRVGVGEKSRTFYRKFGEELERTRLDKE